MRRSWLPREQYIRLRHQQKQAKEAAEKLYRLVRQRTIQLTAELRTLGRAELIAHNTGPEDATAWEALSRIYAQRPRIEAELTALEQNNAAHAFAILRGENK